MRKIIDWSVLYFDLGEKKNVMVLDLGREQLKTAPEYNESDKPIPVETLPRLRRAPGGRRADPRGGRRSAAASCHACGRKSIIPNAALLQGRPSDQGDAKAFVD
jgi:hypothetical protein